MKYKDIQDKKYYRRGRDYPYFSKDGTKMSIATTGEKIKKWFSEKELKDFPHPKAYTGSLSF